MSDTLSLSIQKEKKMQGGKIMNREIKMRSRPAFGTNI